MHTWSSLIRRPNIEERNNSWFQVPVETIAYKQCSELQIIYYITPKLLLQEIIDLSKTAGKSESWNNKVPAAQNKQLPIIKHKIFIASIDYKGCIIKNTARINNRNSACGTKVGETWKQIQNLLKRRNY
jgi:hypothetical protein